MNNEFEQQAIERLQKEDKAGKFQDNKARAMKKAVREALESFCRQDAEFAQAVAQGGSFEDCMAVVAKGVGSSISDAEAFKKAAQFYFKGCEVRVIMEIDVCPNRVKADERPPIRLDVLDLTDFL